MSTMSPEASPLEMSGCTPALAPDSDREAPPSPEIAPPGPEATLKKPQPDELHRGVTPDGTTGTVVVARDRDERRQDVEIAMECPDTVPGLIAFLNSLNHGSRAILTSKNLEYLKRFLTDVVEERNRRAEEIESDEIRAAAALANAYFFLTPFAVLCGDGRITITHRWGMFGGMKAGSIQIPAGDFLSDFVRDERDRSLFLDPKSKFATTIDTALRDMLKNGAIQGNKELTTEPYEAIRRGESDEVDAELSVFQHVLSRPGSDSIVELLDSHTHCAARKSSEATLGRSIADDGLMQDVKRKKEMAEAIKGFGQSKPGKQVIPIQGSFDPHTGFAYVGLESDAALNYAESNGGFTDTVLSHLVDTNVIISSKKLAEEFHDDFERAWASFEGEFSWEEKYKETALKLWTQITTISKKLLPIVTTKIEQRTC